MPENVLGGGGGGGGVSLSYIFCHCKTYTRVGPSKFCHCKTNTLESRVGSGPPIPHLDPHMTSYFQKSIAIVAFVSCNMLPCLHPIV